MNSCRRTKQNFEVFDEKDKKICKDGHFIDENVNDWHHTSTKNSF